MNGGCAHRRLVAANFLFGTLRGGEKIHRRRYGVFLCFIGSGRNSISNDVDFARVGLSYLFNPDNPIDWGPGSSGTRTAGAASTAFGSNTSAAADFFADWQALVARVRANQPRGNPIDHDDWFAVAPLSLRSGRAARRQRQPTTVLDGGKGVDLIVSDRTEIQITMPPYDIRNTPTGQGVFSGFADWGFVRVKQQLASSPSSADDSSSA